MLLFYLKIFTGAIFIFFSLLFSIKYQYKRSFTVASIYTLYTIFMAPYATLYYFYIFIGIMLWLLGLASYFQRSKYEYNQ